MMIPVRRTRVKRLRRFLWASYPSGAGRRVKYSMPLLCLLILLNMTADAGTHSGERQLVVEGSTDGQDSLEDIALAKTLPGHKGGTYALLFSPGGRYLVSGGWTDGTVRVWSVETGREVLFWRLGDPWITCLAISESGEYLATGSGCGRVQVWRLQTGELVGTLGKHGAEISALCFASEDILLSGGGDCTIRLWHVREKLLQRSVCTTGKVKAIVHIADNDTFLAAVDVALQGRACDTATLLVLDKELQVKSTLETGGPLISMVVKSNRGGQVAYSQPGGMYVIDSHTLETRIVIPTGWQRRLAWEADKLVSGGEIPSGAPGVHVWDPQTGLMLATHVAHPGGVVALSLTCDGKMIATCGRDDVIRLWQLSRWTGA